MKLLIFLVFSQYGLACPNIIISLFLELHFRITAAAIVDNETL